MENILQYWSAVGFFVSGVLLVCSEFVQNYRKYRLSGWILYLLGLPALVIILVVNQNWMASALQIAGVPSAILGIVIILKKIKNPSKLIDWCIRIFTCLMIFCGVSYSIYTFNGIRTFSQILEIIIIFGFLISNYLLAKRNPFAWLVLIVGHLSLGTLMFIQNNLILCIQQILSLLLVAVCFIKVIRREKNNAI